jgi:hypothetical protein
MSRPKNRGSASSLLITIAPISRDRDKNEARDRDKRDNRDKNRNSCDNRETARIGSASITDNYHISGVSW